jgi:hypothetical protein
MECVGTERLFHRPSLNAQRHGGREASTSVLSRDGDARQTPSQRWRKGNSGTAGEDAIGTGPSAISTIDFLDRCLFNDLAHSQGILARSACARVRRPYALVTVICNCVSHLWSWTIGSSTREAQRSFDVVASRHNAGPFVSDTNCGFKRRPTIPDGSGTAAGALIDRLMHHGEGIVIQGDSFRMRDKDPHSTDE